MKKFAWILCAAALLCACAPKAEKKEIGVQLYNLRAEIGNPELYAKNHVEVLKALGEMGYTYAEAACYADGKLYGVEPEQYKADLEAAGIRSLSTHIMRGLSPEEIESGDFTEAMKWWDQAIDAHKRAGCQYIVCPGFGIPPTLAGLKVYCDYFNAIGAKCLENGIQFGYHNHSHEFGKLEGEVIYDFMLKNTDPDKVFFEMDVYWAMMGHAAPVVYFRNNPGRFKLLHIKDYRELGQSGMVGFDAIFDNAELAGLENYIVEIEAFTNGDWRESLKACADYLINAPFVKAAYSE